MFPSWQTFHAYKIIDKKVEILEPNDSIIRHISILEFWLYKMKELYYTILSTDLRKYNNSSSLMLNSSFPINYRHRLTCDNRMTMSLLHKAYENNLYGDLKIKEQQKNN